MNKTYVIYGVIGLLLVFSFVIIDALIDEQGDYERALEQIEYYKYLCESAGFIFDSGGHLKSPEEQSEEFSLSWNVVYPTCYEIKNGVEIDKDLYKMRYTNDGFREWLADSKLSHKTGGNS